MIKTLFFSILLFCNYLGSSEFVLFTQPKTATHLLIPILRELTGKNVYWAKEYTQETEPFFDCFTEAFDDPDLLFFTLDRKPWTKKLMEEIWEINSQNGTFLHLHAPYSQAMENFLAEKGCINFFIKRDPRDQIISLLNHYKYIHFNDKEVELLLDDNERLLYLIRNKIRQHTLHYMNWLNSPLCCVLDFEKLMGAHGGVATDDAAIGEMKKIASALQLDRPLSDLCDIYHRHFGKGWSFFKGKVGVWKEYFNDSHKTAVKHEIGDLLIHLGYEKDLDW